jgi:hypothetical protein
MDREKLVKSGRKLGRDLAARIIDRQRQVELPDHEIRFLFAQNITRHTRAMAAEGITEADISFWVDAVAAGYGLRFEEETGKR